jgi:hypothetical protein
MFFKWPISQDPLIGKFGNKRNTLMDFSDNFHNIKSFVQVDHFENILKNRSIFSLHRFRKFADDRKIFSTGKNVCV